MKEQLWNYIFMRNPRGKNDNNRKKIEKKAKEEGDSIIFHSTLYGSEVWHNKQSLERRLYTFYNWCLRTIIGINLGDRMSNTQLLQIIGQPNLENILRPNRLRWFGHANRMMDKEDHVLILCCFEKISKCRYFREMGRLEIHNWRRATLERDSWRKTINQYTLFKPSASDMLDIVQ